jgi:GNAT superfamily N-acetyltransferase
LPPHGSPAEIRPARAEDAGAIAEIWRLGWHDGHDGLVPQELVDVRTPESFHERAAQRVPDTTIAAVEGAVAGFVMVVDDELEQMYVSADHRGTGVAQALIAEAERQVRANGHAKAWLAVVAGNARARRFYERTEWVDEGDFEYEAAAGDRTVFVPCRRYTKLL